MLRHYRQYAVMPALGQWNGSHNTQRVIRYWSSNSMKCFREQMKFGFLDHLQQAK